MGGLGGGGGFGPDFKGAGGEIHFADGFCVDGGAEADGLGAHFILGWVGQ